MNQQIEKIKKSIEPLRQEIINHKVYSAIMDMEDLRIFMKYHVFAVWDFMSLLKTLQASLTCTSVPWFPVGTGDSRYLINEIVAGEESDVDMNGKRKSHFEIYLDAMQECGADISQIESFINVLKDSGNLEFAFNTTKVSVAAKNFVDFTFNIIAEKKAHVQAAVFTFGREDLIPGMFISIVNDLNKNFPGTISVFNYYLERHIEVDGDHHSKLALEMTSNLCADNKIFWEEAERATILALKKRIELWDGVYNELMLSKRLTAVHS